MGALEHSIIVFKMEQYWMVYMMQKYTKENISRIINLLQVINKVLNDSRYYKYS